MAVSIHEQLRSARLAHGLSQQRLAELAGLVRSDIQRLERGDNVGIRTIEKVVAQLPDLKALQLGGVELIGKVTVDVENVRQMVLAIITTSASVLQVLGQPAATPHDEQPAPNDEQPAPTADPLPGAGGATRYQRTPQPDEALQEHLRRINPVYQASRRARRTPPQPAIPAPEPPDDET